jgi:hypothetical protein
MIMIEKNPERSGEAAKSKDLARNAGEPQSAGKPSAGQPSAKAPSGPEQRQRDPRRLTSCK